MVQMHVKPTDSYEFAAWFDIPMKPLDEITGLMCLVALYSAQPFFHVTDV